MNYFFANMVVVWLYFVYVVCFFCCFENVCAFCSILDKGLHHLSSFINLGPVTPKLMEFSLYVIEYPFQFFVYFLELQFI